MLITTNQIKDQLSHLKIATHHHNLLIICQNGNSYSFTKAVKIAENDNNFFIIKLRLSLLLQLIS
ncbi:hypothetical protein HMPREF9104_01529 [Lentilactobacillus kisonensis F0435]|uniref:Uncharacterized protein n=1 Tax=Lentilactobacillus kisonensis F0435 TaxID=797516 RepID=H1LG03_9LACO|nr:hypothetical protein HMPREF9104_01529 [Lentilactobacillus kisonensis F0435]